MKFDWLKALIGDAYTDEMDEKAAQQIGKDFVARKDFNDANEARKSLEKNLAERDAQLEALKKVDPAALQAKITALQAANTTAQVEFDKQVKQMKLDSAIETRLIREGAVNTKAVKALLDNGKISMDGDKIAGLEDQIKALKESEKWAFAAPTSQVPPKSGERQGAPAGADDKGALAEEITSRLFGKFE